MSEDQDAELEAETDDAADGAEGTADEAVEGETAEEEPADGEPTEDEAVDEGEDEAEATDGEGDAGLQEGDFVMLDYTARTVDDGQLVDTTDPDVAAEEGVDDQEQEFEPRTVTLGEGHIFEAVEEDISGKDVGDSGTVTVDAADAFGEYDRDAVETISAEKIDEDDRYPGAHVHVDGRHGHVETIVGGRARVDFNHPVAGEDIEYEYEILDLVEDRERRAASLLQMYIDVSPDVWIETDEVEEEVRVEPDEDGETTGEEGEDAEPEFESRTVEKETLYVEATPQLTMNQQWMMQKQQIGQDVMDTIGVDRVVVQEIIDGMGGMGMPGMMGGMGGMGGGGGDIEAALEDADVDADEIVDELEGEAADVDGE